MIGDRKEIRSASAPTELNKLVVSRRSRKWTERELYWAWRRGEIAAAEF